MEVKISVRVPEAPYSAGIMLMLLAEELLHLKLYLEPVLSEFSLIS
jgi:hypothetical protein